METKIIHVTNGFNWGKMMLGRFTAEERAHPDLTGMGGFLNSRWGEQHVWVMDLDCMAEIVLDDPHGNGSWFCAVCRTVFVYPVHVQSALIGVRSDGDRILGAALSRPGDIPYRGS